MATAASTAGRASAGARRTAARDVLAALSAARGASRFGASFRARQGVLTRGFGRNARRGDRRKPGAHADESELCGVFHRCPQNEPSTTTPPESGAAQTLPTGPDAPEVQGFDSGIRK